MGELLHWKIQSKSLLGEISSSLKFLLGRQLAYTETRKVFSVNNDSRRQLFN